MTKGKYTISNKRIKLRRQKLERLRKKSVNKKKQRNIQKNVKRISFVERKQNKYNYFQPPKQAVITAMSEFSLLDYPENVLSFVKKIDSIISNNSYQIIFIDISNVTKIDIGSIGLLLSKMNELSKSGIHARGNFPKNQLCKNLIYESGFLEHIRDMKGHKINYQENSNLMVNRGFDRTSNSMVGSVIRKAVKHLTGVEESFRPLYSIAQEMCANSIEHANQQNKNWLFSVWYKNQDVVCFTMTDIGNGILGTLKRKASQIIKELLLLDDVEILDRAFEKRYTSQTKDINRNKGLPKIKSISIERYVSNLIVITNNVFLDFSNNEDSKMLNKTFNGTFYYWELNKTCIEIWKNRKKQ